MGASGVAGSGGGAGAGGSGGHAAIGGAAPPEPAPAPGRATSFGGEETRNYSADGARMTQK
ncbi:hypothetical protein C8054_19780 [Micromonospora sp. RP3T]|nr:hypothetical protein C8054_19780 [Micromonospora sp. RP3T]